GGEQSRKGREAGEEHGEEARNGGAAGRGRLPPRGARGADPDPSQGGRLPRPTGGLRSPVSRPQCPHPGAHGPADQQRGEPAASARPRGLDPAGQPVVLARGATHMTEDDAPEVLIVPGAGPRRVRVSGGTPPSPPEALWASLRCAYDYRVRPCRRP